MLLVVCTGKAQGAQPWPVYNVPRIDETVADGLHELVGPDDVFRIDLLAPPQGKLKPVADHDARIWLAWSDKGLFVLARVQDDKWVEHEDDGWLWRYDGIEIFVAPQPGAKDFCQWVISPGMTAKQESLRWRLHDHRKDSALKKLSAEIKATRSKTNDGYALGALFPWEALAIEPVVGTVIGFQVYVNDADEVDGETYHATWFPADYTASDSSAMHRIRLAKRAGPPVLLRSSTLYDWEKKEAVISVTAPRGQAGKEVAVALSGKTVAKGKLTADAAGRAGVRIAAPSPPITKSSNPISIHLAGAALDIPTIGGPTRQFADRGNITDAELFASLDLDRPGLEKIKAAVEKKDYDKAYGEWGRYLAGRAEPKWYVDTKTYGPGMKKRLPKLAEVILARADTTVKKHVAHGGLRMAIKDGKPDYLYNPTGDTNVISLRNMYVIEPLGRAYLITGDPAYADAYRLYTRALYEQRNQIGTVFNYFWIELNVGLRTMHLLDAYLCVREYPGLAPEDHEAALKFFLAFGEALADCDRDNQHAGTPNQRMAGMCALGQLGVMFPEFRNSAEWLTRGVADVAHTLKKTIYPDGAHVELCTQYHMTINRDPGKLSRALALNGHPGFYGDAPSADVFRSLHDWLAVTVAPDGILPPFHSGVYATEWLPHLMIYEHFNPGSGYAPLIEEFYHPEYVPIAKGGPGDTLYLLTPDVLPKVSAEATPRPAAPKLKGINLLPSGTCVMQAGQGDDAAYLGTVYGVPYGGHGYPQLGSFVFYGAGKWLALHPGSPLSYSDPAYESYYHTTFSHNTVIVDGKNQQFAYEGGALGAECDAWVRTDNACILRITHAGYKGSLGVMHTRTFFFSNDGWAFIHDRLWQPAEEKVEHTYDWALHTQLDLREGKARALSGLGLVVVPAYPEEIANIDRQKRPSMLPVEYQDDLSVMQGTANQYYLRKKGAGQVTFGLGLFLLKNVAQPLAVRPIGPTNARAGFEAFQIGDTVILVRNGAEGVIEAGGVSTAAAAAIARLQAGEVIWKTEAKERGK